MIDHERDALKCAVEMLHKCRAAFLTAEVLNASENAPHTAREVATFSLSGHPTASLAYAWCDVADQSVHHRVVLQSGGITSPDLALRGFFLFH